MNNTQETRITATDNPALARKLGFNRWDEDRQQFLYDEDYSGDDTERAEVAEDTGELEGPLAVDYSTWDYRDLQTEARTRSLPASGTAEELGARLAENDRETAAQGPQGTGE